MKTGLLLASLALLVVSCGNDRSAGSRYRAERELWRVQWEQRNLSIRPGQAGEDRWRDLAARYEAIADRYGSRTTSVRETVAAQDVRTIAAHALYGAIRILGDLQDSVRVERIYRRMEQDFADLPRVAAEVALARGQMAERRGETGAAAEHYQTVIDRVPPRTGGTDIAGAILDLPLRIARLRSRGATGGIAREAYAAARAYYERFAGDDASDTLQCDCRVRLAEAAADLGEWDHATQILGRLEEGLRAVAKPARAPCEVRFAIAGIESRTGVNPEVARGTLTALLREYPDCPIASQVLLVLARNAQQRDRPDEALGYLDRVVKEHADDQETASQALLVRARLLESRNRWPEALDAYRGLIIQFPISHAALQAPLEIAMHHSRAGATEATAAALQQAERDYRSLIARYPAKSLRFYARQQLVQALALQRKYDPAIAELVSLGEDFSGTSQGATMLIEAARMAYVDLKDTTRAVAILDHAGQLYANATIGRWASGEAERLRGTKPQ